MTTEQQKRMKKYTSAIQRRLDLPQKVKARVMSDLISSITARQESGMTDEEIIAELGTPQKAAADLNEQMKEYTYRKSPWRFAFLGMAVYGLWKILPGIVVNLFYLWIKMEHSATEAASIGIIGGADGPTSIFVTTPVWIYYLLPVALVLIGIAGFLWLSRCKQK